MTGRCGVCQDECAHLVMVRSAWNISVWSCPSHAVELEEILRAAQDATEVIEIIEEMRK